jgi:hypothetical protein
MVVKMAVCVSEPCNMLKQILVAQDVRVHRVADVKFIFSPYMERKLPV